MRRITADELWAQIKRIDLPLVDAVNAIVLDRVNKAKRAEMERCRKAAGLIAPDALVLDYSDDELEDE